jgi:hypothetical protein
MMLFLTDLELWELRQALDLHLTRLDQELARTEDRDYQRSLHQTFDRLDGIRRRLIDTSAAARENGAR